MGSVRLLLGVCVLVCAASVGTWSQDRVRLVNGGSGPAGVLVDGAINGFQQNDRAYRSPDVGGFFALLFPSIPLDNLTPASQSNEVIGFAPGRAPTLRENVSWSFGGTTVDLELDDVYRIPVYAWIVTAPLQELRARAVDHSIETSRIWHAERQGVAFSRFEVRDGVGAPGADAFNLVDCSDVPEIRSVVGAEPDAINIYYVPFVEFDSGPSQFGAWACGAEFTILMASRAAGVVLVHEFGHLFNLSHPDDLPTYFDATNVMWPQVWSGYLTEGQTFRSVFSTGSALNLLYDVRQGRPTRTCGHSSSLSHLACPALQKRIWAEAGWPSN